jgi:hypothetical protein
MRRALSTLALAFCACNAPPSVDWSIDIDTTQTFGRLKPSLLGQYDLSGALFNYDQLAGLSDQMKAAGLSDWRVGVGRWEFDTRLMPTLSDGTSCAAELAPFPAAAQAPAGTTDLDLIASRDWIDANGNYSLTYFNSVLDVVKAFGANPYIDIDSMPRALAVNQTPSRVPIPPFDACAVSWTDKVLNVRPADPAKFASAVVGLVQRTVEGAHPEAQTWEIWNEPELAYAWDPSFESTPGKIDQFFNMALQTLQALNQYRASSSNPAVKTLRFGFGSFANASTVPAVMAALNTASTPIPIDFFSFHSYSNDPLKIQNDIIEVTNARALSKRYATSEVVLSEWGPDLTQPPSGRSMDPALLAASVLVSAAHQGLDRAMHSLFYDFYPPVPFGLIDNSLQPKPLYYVYSFLHSMIGAGADQIKAEVVNIGAGSTLAARDSSGAIKVLIVNLDTQSQTFNVRLNLQTVTPKSVMVLDDPAQPPRVTSDLVAPARSVVLITL